MVDRDNCYEVDGDVVKESKHQALGFCLIQRFNIAILKVSIGLVQGGQVTKLCIRVVITRPKRMLARDAISRQSQT